VAADDTEREPVLRPWTVGLREVSGAGWSDAAFIVLALAGVSYDGMSETAFGAALLGALLPPVETVMGITGGTFLLVDTLAFAVVAAAFLAAFGLVVWFTHRLVDPDRRASRTTVGTYAATLLPIAAGYLIAHYLTLVIQGAVWLPSLIADPMVTLSPELDWIPIGFIWYLSVASIVAGHVVGIVLAHRLALRDSPSRPVLAGLPMVALMIGYTVLSLWIIAQPIVVEPGESLGALLLR
jgi:nitrate reductase NapE component